MTDEGGSVLRVAQPTSQRELACQRIRAAILSGELAPDVLVTEKQLAASLNMGRTPVREALQDLAREDYLRIVPFRGAIVRSFTVSDLRELYEFRLGLEGIAASLASQRASEDEIRAMVELIDATESCQDDRSYVDANRDIHSLIIRSARNARISNALESARNDTERARRLGIGFHRAFSEHAVEQHRAVVEAIQARDPRLAEERMRQHILNALRLVTATLDLHRM